MADEQVQAVGDQMPRVRVLLQQAVARYILRTGHLAWVLMPEHFKGGPRISLRFIEETRPDFGEQVLVGHGADEETAARDLIAKLGMASARPANDPDPLPDRCPTCSRPDTVRQASIAGAFTCTACGAVWRRTRAYASDEQRHDPPALGPALAFPGDACGSPGRDAICGCGHRAWLHVGDKEACRSLSGLTCRCAAFHPATDR